MSARDFVNMISSDLAQGTTSEITPLTPAHDMPRIVDAARGGDVGNTPSIAAMSSPIEART
jgi:hypothetical protein